MHKREVSQFEVKDVALKCLICGHDQFWKRPTMIALRGWNLSGLAEQKAVNYVCNHCGFILPFHVD